MRICLAQTDIVWEDKAANMRCCRELLAEAAEAGADVVVFPELSLTGFTMNAALAEEENGFAVQSFCEATWTLRKPTPKGDTMSPNRASAATKEPSLAAIFGFACRSGGVITNRVCLAQNGAIKAAYDKIHPFSYGGESAVYSGGERLVTVPLCGMTAGFSICYDLRFPEMFQALSQSCDVIFVTANWPDSRSYHWDTLLRARAVENQCYIAGCNRCGDDGCGLHYSGGSMICSPTGEVIARADSGAQLVYADISAEEVAAVRRAFPLKADRRCKLYKTFYDK